MKNTKKLLLSISLLMGCGLSYAVTSQDLINTIKGGTFPYEEKIDRLKVLLNSENIKSVINNQDNQEHMTALGYQLGLPLPVDPEIVKILLDAGANPNEIQTADKVTPLIMFAWNLHTLPEDQEKIINLLLEAGANPDFKVQEGQMKGKTAYDVAKEYDGGGRNPRGQSGVIKALEARKGRLE